MASPTKFETAASKERRLLTGLNKLYRRSVKIINATQEMTSPTKPQRYSSSCARMLCAVAAASLSTTSLLRTQIANPSVVPIQAKTPAILAWKRGDVLTVGSVILELDEFAPRMRLRAELGPTKTRLLPAEMRGASCCRSIRGATPESCTLFSKPW